MFCVKTDRLGSYELYNLRSSGCAHNFDVDAVMHRTVDWLLYSPAMYKKAGFAEIEHSLYPIADSDFEFLISNLEWTAEAQAGTAC